MEFGVKDTFRAFSIVFGGTNAYRLAVHPTVTIHLGKNLIKHVSDPFKEFGGIFGGTHASQPVKPPTDIMLLSGTDVKVLFQIFLGRLASFFATMLTEHAKLHYSLFFKTMYFWTPRKFNLIYINYIDFRNVF